MAARKTLAHNSQVREKIRTSQLLNRLQDNALAEEEFLTAGQIKSIETLLDRVIPKLKHIEGSLDVKAEGKVYVVSGVPRNDDTYGV